MRNRPAAGLLGTATALGENALSQPLATHQPSKWLLFVETFTRSKDWGQALKLSEEVLTDGFFCPALCKTWKRIQNTVTPVAEDQTLIEAALRDFNSVP